MLLVLIDSVLSLYTSTWVNSLWGLLIWSGEHGILAVIISVFSIILSYLLFWWINIRYGKLIIDFPKDCDIFTTGAGITNRGFYIKLLIYNNGTPDIIIRDSRAIIKQEKISDPFWCKSVRTEGDIKPILRDAFMVIIRGRKGYSLEFEFEEPKSSLFPLKEGDCTVTLEFRLQHRNGWIHHTSHAKAFVRFPRQHDGDSEGLHLTFLDQPTALNKIPEIRAGREQ